MNDTRLGRRLAAASLALALVPFAGAQEPPEPAPDAVTLEYVVGIDDVLRISVWNEPELSITVTVRPDGMITMPFVNDIEAAGLTTIELRDAITTRLQTFVRDPAVAVIVEQINSFKVYVLGEVQQQGVLKLTGRTNLLQAIAQAGGLTQFSKEEVVIVRKVDGSQQRLEISLKRLLSGRPEFLGDNVELRPDDILLVN